VIFVQNFLLENQNMTNFQILEDLLQGRAIWITQSIKISDQMMLH